MKPPRLPAYTFGYKPGRWGHRETLRFEAEDDRHATTIGLKIADALNVNDWSVTQPDGGQSRVVVQQQSSRPPNKEPRS